MALREILLPWTEQPQENVKIDWNNPIAQGLVWLNNAAAPGFNAASGVAAALTKVLTATIEARPYGIAICGQDGGYTVPSGGIENTTKDAISAVVLCRPISGTEVIFGSQAAAYGTVNWRIRRTGPYINIEVYNEASTLATAQLYAATWDNLNAPFVVGFTYSESSGVITAYCNITITATAAMTGKVKSSSVPLNFNAVTNGDGNYFGETYLSAVWNRVLSAVEFQSLYANPWQLFEPRRIQVQVPLSIKPTPTSRLREDFIPWTSQPQEDVEIADEWKGAEFDLVWSAANQQSTIIGPKPVRSANTLSTSSGLSISNGYVALNSAVPSMYTTNWTEIGCILMDSTNQVLPLSARNTGQACIFAPGGINTVVWGVADIPFGSAIPPGITNYVVRRSGSSHVFWRNGVLHGSTTNSSTPLAASAERLPAIGAQAGSGPEQGNSSLTTTNGVLLVARTSKALSDEQIKSLSSNPWQLFKPRKVQVPYTYTAPPVIKRRREILLPWTGQPQESGLINGSHPLGRALEALWIADGTTAPIDLIGGTQSTGGASLTVGTSRIGRTIVGSTAAGTPFTMRAGNTSYPYVAVAHWIPSTNNGWYGMNQAGAGSYMNMLTTAGNNVQIELRRNYATGRALTTTSGAFTVGTPICAIFIAYSNTDYRLFANGEQVNGSISFGSGGVWLTVMTPIGNQGSGQIALVGYGFGGLPPSDEEARYITANHSELWKIFEPTTVQFPEYGPAIPLAPQPPTLSTLTPIINGSNVQFRINLTY